MKGFIRRVLKRVLRDDERTQRVVGWASALPVAALLTSPVVATPSVWVRRPKIEPGDEVCLFLTYARNGQLAEHGLFHARAWSACGFKVVLIVTTDDLEAATAQRPPEFAEGMLARLNRGYDFGGWAAAIRSLPEISDVACVAIANDSVYGPLDSFPAMIARVRESPADVIGLIESFEIRRHFQSFLLIFQNRAPADPAFHRFWRAVRNGGREFVVRNYELNLVAIMERAGLSAMALFPGPADRRNPTIRSWRDLIKEGFPFVKVRALRNVRDLDAQTDWAALLDERGYDSDIVRRHLRGAV